jgi:pimeloyl-ACP methyl ester carboxylesterase
MLGVPLTTPPGEYAVTLSAISRSGEERTATISVVVEALATVPTGATTPPVVLLDGWQEPSSTSSCPIQNDSTNAFGNLQPYLSSPPNSGDYAAPQVYFFENCTECPSCAIEQLGADLGTFLDSIQYSNGTPVPQVDVIAHSMGGLIVRSYLSGKQFTSGAFNPPNNPKVRKAIFIATPHFGSYQASVGDLFLGGSQTNEMTLGSQFLFDLATWNQFGDDLRGADALAIIGNAVLGSKGDGVVSLTSASLRFVEPDVRTRIVPYCHISFGAALALLTGCYDSGIAYIDSPSHFTYQIAQSFLGNNTAWETIGTPPSQDEYLSVNGGLLLANKNASNQYFTDLSSVTATNASLNLTLGPSNSVASLFYDEWVPANTYDFAMWSGINETLTGALTSGAGGGMARFFKEGPLISSVQSSVTSSLPGHVVQSGGMIEISGSGFGQQCTGCQVLAGPPGSTTGYLLPVSSWSDGAISASFLPATMPNLAVPGLVTIYVELSASAWDSINIMTAPQAPTIVVAPTSLRFAYTVGGMIPPAQSIQVTNSGGGTLNWTATTSATWLSVAVASGTAPSALSALVSPTGLGAGTYMGSVQISAAGASNSPVSVTATLTVAPAPAPPVLAVSAQALMFNYMVGATIPAAQSIQVTNSGGGTLNWSATTSATWLSVAAASGTAPSTLSVLVSPTGLGVGTYSGSVQISAAGASGSPASLTVTLTVAPAAAVLAVSPRALTFSYTVGHAPLSARGISITNTGGGTLSWTASASAAWVGLSSASGTAPAMLSVSVNPATLAPGFYSATVLITTAGATGSPASVSVRLVVRKKPRNPGGGRKPV